MHSSNDNPPPLNLVFVDFENVQKVDHSVIGAKAASFTFLLGPKQTKIDTALVEKLMAHAASIHLIRIASSGKNALDFTLAYYLGNAVNAHPAAHFHIVSQDKGFDPLVEHLQTHQINARRHDSFATLPFASPAKPPPAPSRPAPTEFEKSFDRALDHLRKNGVNRPKKKKTLLSHLKSMLGKDATETDAATLLDALQKHHHLSIGEKDAITYNLKT